MNCGAVGDATHTTLGGLRAEVFSCGKGRKVGGGRGSRPAGGRPGSSLTGRRGHFLSASRVTDRYGLGPLYASTA